MSEANRSGNRRGMNPASRENLPNLKGLPTSTSVRPGQALALKRGAHSRNVKNAPEWSPAVREAITDLSTRVGHELRDEDGELAAWAVPSIEAVALQRVQAWRMDRYLADAETRGTLKPADVDLASKVAERYQRALEREALTLRSRIDAVAAAVDPLEAHMRRRAEQDSTTVDAEETTP